VHGQVRVISGASDLVIVFTDPVVLSQLSPERLLELDVTSLSNSQQLDSTSSSQVVPLRSSRRSVKKSVISVSLLFCEILELILSARITAAKYPGIKTQIHSIDFSSPKADYAALGKELDKLDIGVLSKFASAYYTRTLKLIVLRGSQ